LIARPPHPGRTAHPAETGRAHLSERRFCNRLFDTEIRKIVCTTNAIESVNARIRRAVKARGHFPNEAAALKCIYMAIMSLDPTGRGANAGRCAGNPP
jgi:transposase-like protein